MRRESHANSAAKLFRRFIHAGRVGCWVATSGVILTASLQAQERVRTSAAPLPIQSFHQSPEAFFYLGPFQEVLTGSVGVQYTDNVNLSATDKVSDLIFSQGLNLNTTWVISHLNKLQFTFGGQVMENLYGNGRSQLTFSIDPNSLLEFKFAISDWEVRLYDQFSYTQNPTTDPTATNTANLNSFTNTFGAAIEKDLSLALLSFSADFTYNNQSGSNAQGVTNPATSGDRETFRAGPTVTFRLSPSILYGVNVEATRSTGAHSANVNSLNAGPFINGKLSREFEFDLSAGASLIDTKPSIGPNYYFAAAIRYQIDRHWQLLFSASHDLTFTTGTDLTEEYQINFATRLGLTRSITFTTSPFVIFGDVKTNTQGTGVTAGPYTQFGIAATLAWNPRRRWTTALTYNFTRLESGSASVSGTTSNNYIQNTIGLSISYAF